MANSSYVTPVEVTGILQKCAQTGMKDNSIKKRFKGTNWRRINMVEMVQVYKENEEEKCKHQDGKTDSKNIS